MNCSTPDFPVHRQLPEFTQIHVIESVMTSSHLILHHPLILPPSIFPSIKVSSNESVLHIRWPKYWSFGFSISPSSEHSGLICFRINWFDIFAVQGTLKSLLQHHSSKASILGCSAFFIVQLSHPYMTTGKTTALTRCIFVGKVMSLLFNMLPRLLIACLPRSKRLLISPSAVILEPPKIKSLTVSTIAPSICYEVMRSDDTILVFWMLSFKPTFSSSFTFIKRLFSSSLLSSIKVVSSPYLRLLIFLPAILIQAGASSSPTFHIMYSTYKLNKHCENIQPWDTPFLIWNQSVVPCPVLTVASWPPYRFLRRQVRLSGIPISWRIFHSLLWSTQFRYDLNQIPYDYTVEVTNRFKGLDLTECLKIYGRRFVTSYRRQWSKQSPRKKKAKWLSEEALKIAERRREAKGKGEKERQTLLNAEFQRRAKGDKKAFLGEQCKEIEENNRMGKTRDLIKKSRDIKGRFHAKMDTIKDRKGIDLTEAENINKRWQEYTEELYKQRSSWPR